MLPLLKRDLLVRHPREFGEFVGDGAQRQAFLCGNYIVKDRVPAWRHDLYNNDDAKTCSRESLYHIPLVPMMRMGVLPPYQIVVKSLFSPSGAWVIQPYYRPLDSDEREAWSWLNDYIVYWRPFDGSQIRLDFHTNNLGVCLQRDKVHIFDW